MKSILQVVGGLLVIGGVIFMPVGCFVSVIGLVLIGIGSMIGRQSKLVSLQEAALAKAEAAAAPAAHWSQAERTFSPGVGIYRIRPDERVFVDAKGNLIKHESLDALRVHDTLAIRAVWPDGEEKEVIGVFFEDRMLGVLPKQLESAVAQIARSGAPQGGIAARVYKIDKQARDPVVLGYFNLTPTAATFDPDAKPKTYEEQVYTAIAWTVVGIAVIGIAVALVAYLRG